MATARRSVLLVAGIVLALTASCGEDDGGDDSAAEPTTEDTLAATTSTTEPEGVAPEELQGEWVTTLASGEIAELQIGGNYYRIKREEAQGGGGLEVDGDTITFLPNDTGCDATGQYTWSITDGSLTMTMLNHDPCVRKDMLDDRVYTRKDG